MQRVVVSIIAGMISVAACGDPDPPWQAAAAEFSRDLELLEDVEVIRMTREEFSAQAQQNASGISQGYVDYYTNTYGRLGYFDPSIDLRTVFGGSSSDWVGATYSPSAKLITLVGDARDDTFVHEYVHAIQDQHFNLSTYDRLETSDAFLARRAVVEGDATLAQFRFVGFHQYDLDLDEMNWEDNFQARREFSAETLDQAIYPVVFLDYVSFVYTYGLEYAAANLVGVSVDDLASPTPSPHDWRLQDQLFIDRAPESTQQVLQRAFDGNPDDPVVEVGLGKVPDDMTDKLAIVDWDTLGEWYIYLLFHPLQLSGQVDARALASAWDGDKALFVRHQQTGEHAVLWASEWDDEAAAQAVADALWVLYGRNPVKGDPAHLGLANDGELVWIERRGTRLVMSKNLSLDVAGSLVERAFTNTASFAPKRRPSLPATLQRLQRYRCAHSQKTQ